MQHNTYEEKEIQLADVKLLKSLWPFVRPYLWMLLLTTLMVFIVTGFELIMPILTQKGIDHFIIPTTQTGTATFLGITVHSFHSFCLLFLAVVLAGFVIDFIQTLFMEYTGQTIILNLRCRLFSHMTFLPVSFYDRNTSGRLVSRVTNDIENMNEMFTSVLIFICKDLLLMTGILVILFTMNLELTLYITALVPVIFISIIVFSKALRASFRTVRQKIGEINHSFSEAITGIKIIQTASGQNVFIKRFKQLNFEHYQAAIYQIRIFSIYMPFIGFLGSVSVAMILWTGSFDIIEKSMTLGELVAFLAYMRLFFRPLRDLSEKFNLLQSALASAERVVAILDQESAANPPLPRDRQETKTSLSQIHRLEFSHVNFSYKKNQPVLKDISFPLERGDSIGIVGHTGSGKSSIINLITGFYQPDNGHIRFNHQDSHKIPVQDIRNKTALVMQDPFLVSGTVRDNIHPSTTKTTDQSLEKALSNANCDFLFEKFSGLDTKVEEGGRPFSSGEKQLLCIARAFAFHPDLIIFDEATSYMDSHSEQAIHDAMKKLMKGRLSIIIAHRLSTVRHCDNIILLRDGRIKEKGSHEELSALKGEYYHFLQKEKI